MQGFQRADHAESYAFLQHSDDCSNCAHFHDFKEWCGGFAYYGVLGKMFLTFPFGERIS